MFGIIVRNSILLVDFIRHGAGQDKTLREVLLEAGAVRFKPILLTALAAMIGAATILLDIWLLPVVLRNVDVCKLVWKAPAYHSVMQILHNPLYASAYAFGRRAQRTRIVDGRARKASGFEKPRDEWNVLLRDNHPGYISWQEYEDNQKLKKK